MGESETEGDDVSGALDNDLTAHQLWESSESQPDGGEEALSDPFPPPPEVDDLVLSLPDDLWGPGVSSDPLDGTAVIEPIGAESFDWDATDPGPGQEAEPALLDFAWDAPGPSQAIALEADSGAAMPDDVGGAVVPHDEQGAAKPPPRLVDPAVGASAKHWHLELAHQFRGGRGLVVALVVVVVAAFGIRTLGHGSSRQVKTSAPRVGVTAITTTVVTDGPSTSTPSVSSVPPTDPPAPAPDPTDPPTTDATPAPPAPDAGAPAAPSPRSASSPSPATTAARSPATTNRPAPSPPAADPPATAPAATAPPATAPAPTDPPPTDPPASVARPRPTTPSTDPATTTTVVTDTGTSTCSPLIPAGRPLACPSSP